jgi:hypothetical protein
MSPSSHPKKPRSNQHLPRIFNPVFSLYCPTTALSPRLPLIFCPKFYENGRTQTFTSKCVSSQGMVGRKTSYTVGSSAILLTRLRATSPCSQRTRPKSVKTAPTPTYCYVNTSSAQAPVVSFPLVVVLCRRPVRGSYDSTLKKMNLLEIDSCILIPVRVRRRVSIPNKGTCLKPTPAY